MQVMSLCLLCAHQQNCNSQQKLEGLQHQLHPCMPVYALLQSLCCFMQTFGWFAQFGTIAAREHFLVFWLGPLLGGLLAGLTWRAFIVTKSNQQPGNAVLIDKPAASDDSQQTPEPKKAK